ncbi:MULTISPECIES: TonB-dependent siderophore receptor [Sphingomonadaceae]|uniref:TonB-dependent siderophore receptor n=1 Tax=Sphingomonadales TaxID=204457 RepID=UPI0011239010|nr:TonB-dependent siderophore receptor [Sphingobium sp. GW456-12-10-14-TSB1]
MSVCRLQVSLIGLATSLALGGAQSAAAQAASPAGPQDAVSASEIVVLGSRGEGYKVDDLTTATRTGTDIMSVPQSIQFVTRQVIDDQQIIDLTSALRNVSGVLAGTDAGNRSESFTIRGFRSSYYAIDSIMLSPAIQTNDSFRDLANVERIEVLKGPASVLYGRGDPGGLINIVTKQPKFTTGMNLSLQGGSDRFVRAQADVTGAIDPAHTLAFRVIGAAQTSDTFRDVFDPYRRQFASGSLLWQPDERTHVIASLTYAHQANQTDRGIVATPSADGKGLVVDLPRARFLGEPWATTDSQRVEFNYRIEHQIADWLTIRQIGHYDRGEIDLLGINLGNTVRVNPMTGARTLTRTSVRQGEQNHNWDFQLDMVAKFNTFGLNHTIVLGGERLNAYRFRTFDRGSLAAIDIDHPVYGAQPTNFVAADDRTVRAKSNSAYFQDQIDIGEHVNLLGGVRFDHARSSDFGVTGYTSDDKAWSPRFGAVWKPIKSVALFVDYTRSFQSSTAPTISGQPLSPETGEQYEAGIKGEAFNKRLSGTLAIYQLTRAHVAQQDPNNVGFNIDAGEQRSRGVELDISGSITPDLRIIASGAYTEAKVLTSTDFAPGNRLIGVPKWAGSLWLTYEPKTGVLHNFGLGGGVFAAGNRPGDLDNAFKIGGYRRFDLSLWRKVGKSLRVSANIKNLFDEYYIESSVSRAQITPGTGRSALITLSGEF